MWLMVEEGRAASVQVDWLEIDGLEIGQLEVSWRSAGDRLEIGWTTSTGDCAWSPGDCDREAKTSREEFGTD